MPSVFPSFWFGICLAGVFICPIFALSRLSSALPIGLYRARLAGRTCTTGRNCTTTTLHRINATVLKQIQLAKIKQKILAGLGLESVPERLGGLPATPEPPVIQPKPNVTELTVIQPNLNVTEPPKYGDIYTKSEPPDGIRDKSVLQFKVSDWRSDSDSDDKVAVHNGFLYVFVKKRGRKSRKNKRITLRISTVDERGKPKKLLSSLRIRLTVAEWHKIGLPSDLLQHVIENPNDPLRLHVRCKKCKKSVVPVLVFKSARKNKRRRTKDGKLRKQSRSKRRALNKKRPILIIHTKTVKTRSKRQTNVCDRDATTGIGGTRWDARSSAGQGPCCKRSFYLNFTEIGWDDWIISPEGYVYSECEGGCSNRRTSITLDTLASNATSSSHTGADRGRRQRPRKQCRATRSLPLRVVYFDEALNVVRKRIPNMVVASCGCRTVH